jgi:hypothetical protein
MIFWGIMPSSPLKAMFQKKILNTSSGPKNKLNMEASWQAEWMFCCRIRYKRCHLLFLIVQKQHVLMKVCNMVLPDTVSADGAASEGIGGATSTGLGCAGVSCISHIHTTYRPESGTHYWPDLLP